MKNIMFAFFAGILWTNASVSYGKNKSASGKIECIASYNNGNRFFEYPEYPDFFFNLNEDKFWEQKYYFMPEINGYVKGEILLQFGEKESITGLVVKLTREIGKTKLISTGSAEFWPFHGRIEASLSLAGDESLLKNFAIYCSIV